MTIELHDLAHEFPEHKDKLHTLKLENAHFVHLKSQYDDVNHQIRLYENGVNAASDEHMETLKKQRLHLKDQIAAMLAA
ncbi:YdcH family protein [Thermomonas sp.]|uniref:YdcH family protein n=1 Tax=Thermomonas sp. TaxID=1971895 RepID=UPI002F1BC579